MKKSTSGLSATASGSATGNPRNKVSLGPGRALIDWIKLGHSGTDLTGVGGKPRDVTKAELSKHNKPSDCWIAIRGVVFNVTHYLPFHPGGEDQLLLVAGTDATEAFDDAHAYVNYTSILQKCVVGRLITSPKRNPTSSGSLRQPSLASCPPPTSVDSISAGNDDSPSATADWIQTPYTVTIAANWDGPHWPITWLELDQRRVLLRLYSVSLSPTEPATCAEIRLALEADVQWPPELAVDASEVHVTFMKKEASQWTACHREPVKKATAPARWSLRLESSRPVTHDTRLLLFSVQSGAGTGKQMIWLPPGLHVNVQMETITEGTVSRSYTPVPACLVPESCLGCSACPGHSRLCLMVKRYPQGAVSPMLCSLSPGDKIEVTGPEGRFQPDSLLEVSNLTMLAAGTGITPMLSTVLHFLERSTRNPIHAHLVFFNRTKADILWRKQLKEFSVKEPRFSVEFVLSDPGPSWPGRSGRVNQTLLTDLKLQAKDSLVLACGPIGFTHAVKEMLLSLGLPESGIYCFLG